MVVGRRVSRWVVFGGTGVVVGLVLGIPGSVVVLVRLVGVFVARRGGVARRDGALVLRTALVCVARGAWDGGIDAVRGRGGSGGRRHRRLDGVRAERRSTLRVGPGGFDGGDAWVPCRRSQGP